MSATVMSYGFLRPVNAPQNEIDYERTLGLFGIIGGLYAAAMIALAWVKKHVISEAEHAQIKESVADLKQAADEAKAATAALVRMTEKQAEIEDDIRFLYQCVDANRDVLLKIHTLMAMSWNVERREGERRQFDLPPFPERPDRRIRGRRKTDDDSDA